MGVLWTVCWWLKAPAGLDIGAHPFVRAAIASRQPVISNDLGNLQLEDPVSRALFAHGCRALAALPLVVAGEGVGCLLLMSAEAGLFDGDEMRLLEHPQVFRDIVLRKLERRGEVVHPA